MSSPTRPPLARSSAGAHRHPDRWGVAAVDGLPTRGGTTLGSARVAPEKLNPGRRGGEDSRGRFDRGDSHVIGVVAEGAHPKPDSMPLRDGGVDEYGHHRFTGVAQQLGEAAHEGAHGQMVALRGPEIELVPLTRAVAKLKTVTPSRLAETGAFTG